MMGGVGQRVELNAMTSEQFLNWLEQKLADAGVRKSSRGTGRIGERLSACGVRKARARGDRGGAHVIDEDEEIPIPSDLERRFGNSSMARRRPGIRCCGTWWPARERG